MILADPDGAADAIQKAFTGIVAKLSAISSRRTRERGDGNAAAASIYSTVRLTRVVNQTAFGGPLAARGVTDLDFMLSRARPDDAALARLATAFAEVDREDTLKQRLLRQRAILLDSLRRGEEAWLTRPIILRAMNTRLEQLAALIARASQPWPRRLLETPEVYSTLWTGWPISDARMMLSMRDSDEYQVTAEASSIAHVRSARVVIAAVRHRAAHGAWPPSASSLVPEFLPAVPIDAFRGEPIRPLVEDNGGFVAYSVGLNNRDERGRLLDNAGRVRGALSRGQAEGDIGVRVRLPRP